MNRIEINAQTGEVTTVELTPSEVAEAEARAASENDAAHANARIDQKILDLEKQAIEQGLIRTVIDDLLIRSVQIAAAAGVTEAQLLTPSDPHYSRAYEKVKANAVARATLRAQKT